MDSISQSILNFIENIPLTWQMIALSFFSFAEGLPIIGSILPGGTIAIFAGSLSANGTMNAFFAFLLVGISSFLGDMVGFLLGKKFLHFKWIKNIVHNEKYKKSWDLFDRHIAIITIFGKLIPVIRSTPSLLAAVRGVKSRKYILYSFIGSLLWGAVGIYAGNFFTKYFGEKVISFIFILIIISILIVLIQQTIKQIRKKNKNTPAEK